MAQWSLFPDTLAVDNFNDPGSVNLGTEFEPYQPVLLKAIRFYNGTGASSSTLDRQAAIYQVTGGTSGTVVYGPVTIPAPAQGSWGYHWLPTPITLSQNVRYRVVVQHPGGQYAATHYYFSAATGWAIGPLWLAGEYTATGGAQGSYTYADTFEYPTSSFNASSYYSDIVVDDDVNGGTIPFVWLAGINSS